MSPPKPTSFRRGFCLAHHFQQVSRTYQGVSRLLTGVSIGEKEGVQSEGPEHGLCTVKKRG